MPWQCVYTLSSRVCKTDIRIYIWMYMSAYTVNIHECIHTHAHTRLYKHTHTLTHTNIICSFETMQRSVLYICFAVRRLTENTIQMSLTATPCNRFFQTRKKRNWHCVQKPWQHVHTKHPTVNWVWRECVGVCWSVLECVAVCCSVLQCGTNCELSVTWHMPYVCDLTHVCVMWCTTQGNTTQLQHCVCCSVLRCVAVCCSVLQWVVVSCTVLHWVAVCCSVLQCVAVCCSVLRCVAARGSVLHLYSV